MKLKTKLIPLTCMLSASVVATPLCLTSCSNDGLVSMLDRFVPSIEQHKHEIMSLSQVHDTYIEAVQANTDIFMQDFYWYASNSVISAGTEYVKYHKIKISDVACSKYEVIGRDYKYVPTLSFTMNYESEYHYNIDNDTACVETYTGTSIYKNIPIIVSQNPELGLWFFDSDLTLLQDKGYSKEMGWSAQIKYQKQYTYTLTNSIYGPYTYTDSHHGDYHVGGNEVIIETFDEYDAEQIQAALSEDAHFYSWYLYNIEWSGE